jgi:hypothetical protein
MRRVVIESPYAGDVALNLRYLRACMRDCILRGESPYASHALLTKDGVLDDDVPAERALGIRAGFAWRDVADATVVYTDLGMSTGVRAGIDDAITKGRPIEYRSFGGEWRDANVIQIQDYRAWADAEIDRLRGVVRKYEESAPELLAPWPVIDNGKAAEPRGGRNAVRYVDLIEDAKAIADSGHDTEVIEFAGDVIRYVDEREAEIGRLSMRKMTSPPTKIKGDFMVDYDTRERVTSLCASRGDRSVSLDVRTVVDENQRVVHYDSSVAYGLYGPSLKRIRDGFRGELACDTSERVVQNATAEDLIVALRWLVGEALEEKDGDEDA